MRRSAFLFTPFYAARKSNDKVFRSEKIKNLKIVNLVLTYKGKLCIML